MIKKKIWQSKELLAKFWPLISVSLFAGVCAWNTADAVNTLWWNKTSAVVEAVTAQQLTTIEGRRLSNTNSFHIASVTYSYVQDNHKFTTSKVVGKYAGRAIGRGFYQKLHPPGSVIDVWVNPKNPSASSLAPVDDLGNRLILLAGSCILLAGVATIQLRHPSA